MSKIGRKPIDIDNVEIKIVGNKIHYKGKLSSGIHELPDVITAKVDGNQLQLIMTEKSHSNLWGLHRALVANKITGANKLFEKKLQINGLGFKAESLSGKIKFSLGFSHKIEKVLPKDILMEIDKTGQQLMLKSFDKQLLGQFCADIRALRPPEPYKGTGIKYENEVIIRKAGKTKAA